MPWKSAVNYYAKHSTKSKYYAKIAKKKLEKNTMDVFEGKSTEEAGSAILA